MQRWAGRVALVTGASVGIGAATAESLVKSGMTVVGCARNVAQIEASTCEKHTGFSLSSLNVCNTGEVRATYSG